MSKIYGFGNALIDIEIQINEDQLSSIGIPKGGMQHISRDEKDYFLKIFKTSIKPLSMEALFLIFAIFNIMIIN